MDFKPQSNTLKQLLTASNITQLFNRWAYVLFNGDEPTSERTRQH